MQAPILWSRLEAASLALGTAAFGPKDLTEALQRCHHVSADDARAVSREYLRFHYLAAIADAPLAPSRPVAEMWRLHRADASSYARFCADHLQCPPLVAPVWIDPLADPAYRRTRALYRSQFGPPPVRLWPDPDAMRHRDRLTWLRNLSMIGAIIAAMTMHPGLAAGLLGVWLTLRWWLTLGEPPLELIEHADGTTP
jgi:hypothetical protein